MKSAICMAAWAGAALLLSGCADRTPESLSDLTAQKQLHLAELAAESGADDFALSMYQEAALKAPRSAPAQARYARALLAAGKIEQARIVLRKALERCGPHPELALQRGRIELADGAADAALRDFISVLEDNPADVPSLINAGIALDMLNRHEDAQAKYRAALTIAPDNISAINNLAMSYLLTGQARSAANLLAPVADRPDATQRTRDNLAVALAMVGGRAQGVKPAGTDTLSQPEITSIVAALSLRQPGRALLPGS
jgi:Flp pilus assembly protein TadD